VSVAYKFRRAAVDFEGQSIVKGKGDSDWLGLCLTLFSKQKDVVEAPIFNHVEAIAPASSANLGAGFDVFGVALDTLFDRVSVDVVKGENNIKVFVEGEGSELVPTNPDRNTAGIVAKALLKIFNKNYGLVINIEKGIRPGSGLGSSAASAAASALAINEALQLNLPSKELIKFAALGEVAAAGAPHADNVSSAILGFFTAIVSHNPFEVIRLLMPKNTAFVIATPEIFLETSSARLVLPKRVKLLDAVHNIAKTAAFVAGVMSKDITLMGMGMNDSLAEPYRAHLIPGLADVKKMQLKLEQLELQ
jgi:homoserine kinase